MGMILYQVRYHLQLRRQNSALAAAQVEAPPKGWPRLEPMLGQGCAVYQTLHVNSIQTLHVFVRSSTIQYTVYQFNRNLPVTNDKQLRFGIEAIVKISRT